MIKSVTAYVLLISCFCCKVKEDRDHLVFKSNILEIERNILTIDSLLKEFPLQKNPDKIQSYYYEVKDLDSVLFINTKRVGVIHNISVKEIAKQLHMTEDKSSKFINASLILLRNNISNCLNDYCGWVYVYKYSDDRGEYRPVIYAYNDSRTQFMIDHCSLEIIDRKGNIILFKEK